VPKKSPLLVCYLTFFKSNVVSVTTFKMFAAKITDLDLGQLKVKSHPKSTFVVPIDSARVVSNLASIDTIIV